MSFWSGIKYALNSTLGTENFKPLDKKIIEQMRMLPSDEIYYSFENVEHTLPAGGGGVEKTLPYTFKMIRYGTARFNGTLYLGSFKVAMATIAIYKNGQKIYEFNGNNNNNKYEFPFSTDINFNPYDVFEFKLSGSNSNFSMASQMGIKDFSLCGTIEHNFFEFI
jgi:hypothetical protein